jgi:TRAP-type mannitol/chloroaromatic compound transport system substrate-binding protein
MERFRGGMTRRSFLAGGALAASAVLSPFPALARNTAKGVKLRWRMAVSWSRNESILLRAADRFVKQVSLLTESRLAIDLHGAGSIAGPGEVARAVASGEVDCGHCFAHELGVTSPAADWFYSVPFGMSRGALNDWFYADEGLSLLSEASSRAGLMAFPMGDTGVRPFCWTGREIGGPEDLRGLEAAMPAGPARALMKMAGAGTTSFDGLNGSDYMFRGKDRLLGSQGAYLDTAARINASAERLYLAPELAPTGRLLFIVNLETYKDLHAILRFILEACCAQEDMVLQAELAHAETEALKRLAGHGRTRVARLPEAVVRDLASMNDRARRRAASEDSLAGKVDGKYHRFQNFIRQRTEPDR